MSWLTLTALVLLLAAGAALAYASTRPDAFSIERSTVIAAPPSTVFPMIDSLKRMNEWNPFVQPDPNIKIAYWGPDMGVGAGHSWDGNGQVGKGTIEIIESQPNSNVAMRLRMVKPMAADNRVTFELQPATEGTRVTWRMQGRQPFIGKIMTLVIDCDVMVGKQFEKGLAALKALAER